MTFDEWWRLEWASNEGFFDGKEIAEEFEPGGDSAADDAAFDDLDEGEISAFLDWLETHDR
jgi:hypothetical protein